MGNQTNFGLEKFLRKKQLLGEGYFPGSSATLWRHVRAGTFPAPVKLSSGMTAWKLSDVLAWQVARAEVAA